MFANWVLAPLNLIDRDGGQIQYYRLFLDGGWGVGEFFAWITSDILYLVLIVPAAYSSQLLDFAINPETWLRPIEQAWTTVTAKLFTFISPTVLLAGVLLIALLLIAARARNADEALQDMIKRTIASLGMYVLILALLYNPAGTLLGVLTGWVRLLGDFDNDTSAAVAATDAAAATTDSSVLTNFLRPLTWMLNYGSQLSPECAKAWVKLIHDGTPITCLTPDQIQASQSVGTAFIMTLLALIPVWIYCRFAIVVLITFATHLGLAIVRFAAAAAMAALSPWQDRPFDEFIRFMVSAVANLLVATGVITIARLGPSLAVSIAESVTDSTLVHFAALVLVYHILAVLVWGLEKKFGPIRDWLLKSVSNTSAPEPGTSRWWSLAFPGGLNPQATALDRIISQARHRGSQWADQTREQVNKMANARLRGDHNPALETATAAAAATPGVVADTPQTEAALSVVNTVNAPAHTDPDTTERAAKARSLLTRIMPLRPVRPELHSPTTAAHTPTIDHTPQLPTHPAEPHPHSSVPSAQHTPTALVPPTNLADPELAERTHWRQRLQQDSLHLATSAAPTDGFTALQLASKTQTASTSTFDDARGNALDSLGPRAAPSAHIARIAYIEVVTRAMGIDPHIDAQQLLPSRTRCFTSGQDESGKWITEFHN